MKGAFLAKEDARLFDHSFFGMTRLEVETMDPSQRKLLEVSYEAIENAGDTNQYSCKPQMLHFQSSEAKVHPRSAFAPLEKLLTRPLA